MTKVWFITGSSRGLGKAVAEFALKRGDNVIVTARKQSALEPLVETYGSEILLALELDVSDYQAAITAVEAGVAKFGRVDIVVNNAGYADLMAVEDVDMERYREQVEVNFFGVVHVTKAVLPHLRSQGSGHIFQISSLGSRLGTPGLSAYQSSKWAVSGFTVGLAAEVAPLGIRVTSLEPGGIKTDWAGSSMQIPPISQPYEQTVGQFARHLRQAHGSEPTEPADIAKIIQHVYESSEPPVRLLVGPQALEYGKAMADKQAQSDKDWAEVSVYKA